MVKLVLLAAAFTTDGTTQQDWIDQLGAADRLLSENRHHDAEVAYITARKQAETFGLNELPMAITLNHMGHQYQILGRLRDAERAHAAALAIVEGKFGTASPNAVRVALDLSTVYLELGEVSKTESLIRRFLRQENELSPTDRANLLAELASVQACRRKFADAESLYRAALPLFEADPTREFRERTIIALSNLSTVYMHMERFSEGVTYSNRALALLSTMTDPAPLLVFKTTANAAAIAAQTGKVVEAESLFQLAISYCEQSFGRSYYLLGYVMDRYAEFLRRVGRRAEAKTATKRAKAIIGGFGRDNILGFTVDAKAFR